MGLLGRAGIVDLERYIDRGTKRKETGERDVKHGNKFHCLPSTAAGLNRRLDANDTSRTSVCFIFSETA